MKKSFRHLNWLIRPFSSFAEDRELRLRRIIYRAGKRGISENGIILNEFIRQNIAHMKDEELSQLENILQDGELELFGKISGTCEVVQSQAPIIDRLKEFVQNNMHHKSFTETHKLNQCGQIK